MRVVIEIQSGPQSGRKLLLREQELLVFGRSEWADVAFEQDVHMSARHFSLQVLRGEVCCHDLDSSNGTTVNQRPVREMRLRNGDIIVAGRTQMIVLIEGDGSQSPQSSSSTVPLDVHGITPELVTSHSSGPVTCTAHECPSGLLRVRGGKFGEPGQPAAASHLALRITKLYPLSLVVHAQQIKHPALQGLSGAVPLFDWMSQEVATTGSPLIIPPECQADRMAIIDAAWDKNVVLSFYSRRPSNEVIQHLRSATNFRVPSDAADIRSSDLVVQRSDASDQSDSRPALLGYCWPSVLVPLLTFSQPAFVQRLLDGIELVLMEVPDRPRRWQIFGRSDLFAMLAQVGFTEATAERVVPAQ